MLDREPSTQNEILLHKQSSIFQLTLPYNTKKNSVFILLIQLFYIVAISILIFLGFFFLFFSSSSSSSSSYANELNEITTKWSTTALVQFKSLLIELLSKDQIITLHYNDSNPGYTPLYFYSANGASLLEYSGFNKKYNDILFDSYNLTISIVMNISGTIVLVDNIDGIIKTKTFLEKEDCLRNKYVYNEESDICYQFFTLKSLCLVIDTDSKALVDQYKEFKCNQFTQWYESFKILQWPFSDTTPGRNEIKDQGMIEIKVFSYSDPYVWNSYNKQNKIKSNDHSHFTLGVWMVLLAIGLILFGLWFYLKKLGEKESARIANIKQHHQDHTIQMAEFTESSESDTKVRIPTLYNNI